MLGRIKAIKISTIVIPVNSIVLPRFLLSQKTNPDKVQFIFDTEWVFLEDYLDRIESFLLDEKELFDDWTIGQTETLSPEQQEEFYFKEVETYLLNKEFPKFLRLEA